MIVRSVFDRPAPPPSGAPSPRDGRLQPRHVSRIHPELTAPQVAARGRTPIFALTRLRRLRIRLRRAALHLKIRVARLLTDLGRLGSPTPG